MVESEGKINIIRVFPMGFTLFCLLVFTPLVIKSLDSAFDPDWMFLVGDFNCVCCFLPIFFIVGAHVRHFIRKAPSRFAVLLGIFGPGVVMLVSSVVFIEEASTIGVRLVTDDCHKFAAKSELEKAWQSAYSYLQECISQHDNALFPIVTLEDCPDYAQKEDRMWRYLKSAEKRHMCGGWCSTELELWGGNSARLTGSCSTAVGDSLLNKIKVVGLQILLYTILLLVVVSLAVVVWGPKLRSSGIDW